MRTSVAVIAFGFVVERFSLFLKYLIPSSGEAVANPRTGLLGALLIWLGTLMVPVCLWRFLIEQRQIDQPTGTQSSNWPMITLAILLAAVGLYLAVAIVP
jgi:putative membrane protein